MSGFSGQWLAMREAADAKARSAGPVQALNRWLRDRALVNIIDLGCGTGSNLRWLAPRLAARQHWRLLDNDPRLLTQARDSLCAWTSTGAGTGADPGANSGAGTGSTMPNDVGAANQAAAGAALGDAQLHALALGKGLTAQLTQHDLSVQLPALHGGDLLCASALLDLVSRHWLSTLLGECQHQQLALYFALNYDGRMRFTPAHTDDAMIRDALNRDQLTDKGFGPALGPDCVQALHRQCQLHGYRVVQWRSDWRLGTDDQAMHRQLVADFAQIAERNLPRRQHHRVHAWRRWRCDRLSTSTLAVGHVDTLALPRSAVARHRHEAVAQADANADADAQAIAQAIAQAPAAVSSSST